MSQKFTNLSFKKQDASTTVSFHVNKEKGTVVCRLYDRWYDMYHVGKAHCLDTDKFSEKTGRAIAFNKARLKELAHNLAMIEDDRQFIAKWYEDAMAKLDKRASINEIYVAGCEADLKDLIGVVPGKEEAAKQDYATVEIQDEFGIVHEVKDSKVQ